MIKKVIFGASLLMILGSASSCKKGECTCQVFGSEVSATFEAEDRDEYKQLKDDCESSGCKWSAKL